MSKNTKTVQVDREFVSAQVQAFSAEVASGGQHRVRLAAIIRTVRDADTEGMTLAEFARQPEVSTVLNLPALKQQAAILDIYEMSGGKVSRPDGALWQVAQGLYNVRPHVEHAGAKGAKAVEALASDIKEGKVSTEDARTAVREARRTKDAATAQRKAESSTSGPATVKVADIGTLRDALAGLDKWLADGPVVSGDDLPALREALEHATAIREALALHVKAQEAGAAKVAAKK